MAPPRKRPPKPVEKPTSVEKLAKPPTRARRTGIKPEPKDTTVTRIVARAQQIVRDRDESWMTWTEIAQKHKISEKTARRNYHEYVEAVAPLVRAEFPDEVGHELLRKLQGVQTNIAKMAATSVNESVRLGAYNSLTRVLQIEIELRQSLGLLPKVLGDIRLITDQLWAAEQIVTVLREMDAPPDAYQRVSDVLRGVASN